MCETIIDAAAQGATYRQIVEATDATKRSTAQSPAPIVAQEDSTNTVLGNLLTGELQRHARRIQALNALLCEDIQPALERLLTETASYEAATELLADES